MGAQPLTVVMRALRSYTAVGLNQLLGEIVNYVDHLVEIRGARMPENGVANDVLERWANTSICLTLGLPECASDSPVLPHLYYRKKLILAQDRRD